MKRIKVKLLGLEAEYDVPATIPECQEIAPPAAPDGSSTLVDRIVNQTLYHQAYGDWRGGLVDRIKKETSLSPISHKETDEKTKKEKEIVDEKDAVFVARALSEDAVTRETLTGWLQEMCDDKDYAFAEYLKSERRHAEPKKLSKEIERLVEASIKDGTAPARAAKLSKLLNRVVDANDALSLGTAMRDHQRAALDAARAAALAEMSAP